MLAKFKQPSMRAKVIWAILVPPAGLILGIRLLIRDRVGPGLGLILIALLAWGAETLLLTV